MAYTRSWDDTKPTGSEAANTIDDLIRELKEDIHERMDDLVVDWTDDPVVLQAQAASWKGRKYSYQDLQSPGNKAVSPNDIKSILHLSFSGVTDSAARIVLNLNEITNEVWSVANFVNLVGHLSNNSATSIVYIDPNGTSIDVGANTITLTLRNYDGSPTRNASVTAWLTLYFNTVPSDPAP